MAKSIGSSGECDLKNMHVGGGLGAAQQRANAAGFGRLRHALMSKMGAQQRANIEGFGSTRAALLRAARKDRKR